MESVADFTEVVQSRNYRFKSIQIILCQRPLPGGPDVVEFVAEFIQGLALLPAQEQYLARL